MSPVVCHLPLGSNSMTAAIHSFGFVFTWPCPQNMCRCWKRQLQLLCCCWKRCDEYTCDELLRNGGTHYSSSVDCDQGTKTVVDTRTRLDQISPGSGKPATKRPGLQVCSQQRNSHVKVHERSRVHPCIHLFVSRSAAPWFFLRRVPIRSHC